MMQLRDGDIVLERVPIQIHPDGYCVGVFKRGAVEWYSKNGKLDRYQNSRLVLSWDTACKIVEKLRQRWNNGDI